MSRRVPAWLGCRLRRQQEQQKSHSYSHEKDQKRQASSSNPKAEQIKKRTRQGGLLYDQTISQTLT